MPVIMESVILTGNPFLPMGPGGPCASGSVDEAKNGREGKKIEKMLSLHLNLRFKNQEGLTRHGRENGQISIRPRVVRPQRDRGGWVEKSSLKPSK